MAGRKKKKEIKIARYMHKKLIAVFVVIFVLLALMVIQLVRIQKDRGEKYSKIVLDQQGYGSTRIPFRRGDILDTKGTVLATSVDVYNVILDCKMILEKDEYVEPTIQALITCFPDVTAEEVRTLLEERPKSQYCILRRRLPYETIRVFQELQEEVYEEGKNKGKKKNPNVMGVWFEKEYIRNYPYDSLACKVLGFTTSGNVGIGGLEDYYNDTLNGIDGRSYGYLNTDSDVERTIKEAINGNTVVSTIEYHIQQVVEEKIAAFNEAHRDEFQTGPGSANTAVIVMDPGSGAIYAMADSASYSLSDPWNQEIFQKYCMDYKGYTSPEEIEALGEDGKLDLLNALWQNFCITYTYEPGSTVKPLTVAAGLDTGVVVDGDTFLCDGGEMIPGYPKPIHCVNNTGHGIETLEKALMDSCNDALMQIGQRIGIDDFVKYQNIFNIGLRTNIDLPGEGRTDSLIYTAERMSKDATALPTNSFGQNFNVTMIQVASAVSSIINGGYYYQPHLVRKIVDEDGNTVQSIEPTVLKQTVSSKTSDLVRGYLVSTVKAGTGKSAKVPGYSMGGKTGTAEKQPRGEKKYLISFIGFAPAENPQVLIYVVINEPNVENQAQSSLATGLAKEIMTEILPYLNIFPDEELDQAQETIEGQTQSNPAEEDHQTDIFE